MSDRSSLSNCRPPSCKGAQAQSVFKAWPSCGASVSSKASDARAGLGLDMQGLRVADGGDASPRMAGLVFLGGKTTELGTCTPWTLPG